MAVLTVHNCSGEAVGTYEVDPAELVRRISKQLLHDVVVMYQANQRQGSAKTKNRGEVRGSTKKLYRQKGTGNARAGSRRSGVRRGGGHIFALRPRDHHYTMPRKAVRLATSMAVAAKIRDDEVVMVDELAFAEPKTSRMASICQALGCQQQTLLVATAAYDENVYRSARNMEGVTVAPAAELNAYLVLRSDRLLLTPAAMDVLKARTPRRRLVEAT